VSDLFYIGLFAILAINGLVILLAVAHAINGPRAGGQS
jgi:hypothetical protein